MPRRGAQRSRGGRAAPGARARQVTPRAPHFVHPHCRETDSAGWRGGIRHRTTEPAVPSGAVRRRKTRSRSDVRRHHETAFDRPARGLRHRRRPRSKRDGSHGRGRRGREERGRRGEGRSGPASPTRRRARPAACSPTRGRQLADQASTQKQRAADGLRNVGSQLLLDGRQGSESRPRQRPRAIALAARGLGGELALRPRTGRHREARSASFARRNTVMFLAIAAGIGIVADRAARALREGEPDQAARFSGTEARLPPSSRRPARHMTTRRSRQPSLRVRARPWSRIDGLRRREPWTPARRSPWQATPARATRGLHRAAEGDRP